MLVPDGVDSLTLASEYSQYIIVDNIRVHYNRLTRDETVTRTNQVRSSQQLVESNSNLTKPLKQLEAVVLLHGFGGSTFSWRKVMAPLAQSGIAKTIVAFDRLDLDCFLQNLNLIQLLLNIRINKPWVWLE